MVRKITEDEVREIANLLLGLKLTKPGAFMFNDLRTINSFYVKATGEGLFEEGHIDSIEKGFGV